MPLSETGRQLKSIGAVATNTPEQSGARAQLGTDQRDDSHLENAVRIIGAEPGGVLGGLVGAERDRAQRI